MSRSMPSGDLSVQDIVRLLGLLPHPEGGFFVETFRDAEPAGGRHGRPPRREGRTHQPGCAAASPRAAASASSGFS